MNKDNLNISKIESYLNSIIDNKVSQNTFVGSLPNTIESSWTDLVLIDVASSISDLNAYGHGTVLIWLYARPSTKGIKNVAKLSKMEQALNEIISTAKSDTYQINRRRTYQDYDAERKLHTNIVEININII
jgi:hypothetical protein